MKGHVPTPASTVDAMVEKLFAKRRPQQSDIVLDPGTGDGPFIEGVIRYCKRHGLRTPRIVGVELNPTLLAQARAKFRDEPRVELVHADFLSDFDRTTDYVIGNPPYVSIAALDAGEKTRYRALFETASGRFDLYVLFFDKALRLLKDGGRLCFITPEKYEYVETTQPLRRIMTHWTVEEIEHVHEDTFPDLVTYPTITTLTRSPPRANHKTTVRHRDGTQLRVSLPKDGRSWRGVMSGVTAVSSEFTLEDVAERISCGVATGADSVFVMRAEKLPATLKRFAHPTISGRQLALQPTTGPLATRDVLLMPYTKKGDILSEEELGDLRTYLRLGGNLKRLEGRTCVTVGGKSYYQFHDNVPPHLFRPKLLCKDIAQEPCFWADHDGRIVPRHSTYYIVPKPGLSLAALQEYLNSEEARAWLRAHTQRAAKGYYRLQSSVLKRLPVPSHLVPQAKVKVSRS